jgi:hypothetical protein
MVTVCGYYIVVGPQLRHDAGRYRLLSDIQVTEPPDLSQRICLSALLLEAAL